MGKGTRKQVAEEVIGLGALAQLSRNKKVNNLGEVGIMAGLIILIGEMIKFCFKWLLIKPIIFCFKYMFLLFKYILIYGGAFVLTLIQNMNRKQGKNKEL